MIGRARDIRNDGCATFGAHVVYAGHSAIVRTPSLRHSLMRLTASIFGLELDISLGLATTAEEADDPAARLNGGTLAATPMTFFPSPAAPMEWQPPERTIPWDPEDREAT